MQPDGSLSLESGGNEVVDDTNEVGNLTCQCRRRFATHRDIQKSERRRDEQHREGYEVGALAHRMLDAGARHRMLAAGFAGHRWSNE